MKLKCVILDDEPMARNFLERYCAKTPQLELLGSFGNAEEAFVYLKETEIDILFLDVEMPGDNGFELLDKLIYMPRVILTTSKTEYAFNAFEYHVTDFLKKPITYNRFLKSIEKAATSASDAATDEPKEKDFFIKAEGKLIRLSYEDILYIESVGDYVKYFTASKNYLTHSTLKAVEERMGIHQFMKIHRSYIVNLRKIKDIQDNSVVIEGKVIPISKSLRQGVMQKLNVV
jgi:DNA-binding LytR/AlgR family response regulator